MVAQIDGQRFSRADLGKLAMPQIKEHLEEISRQMKAFVPHADAAGNALLREAKSRYQAYLDLTGQIGNMAIPEFSNQHQGLERNLEESWGRIMEIWPLLAVIVADRSGLLWNSATLQNDLEASSQRSLAEIREVGAAIIDDAKKLAASIEAGARKTATGISVVAAQIEFNAAQRVLRRKATWWAILSALSFAAFFAFAFFLYNKPLGSAIMDKSQMVPELIFHGILRITILTGIGALATFMLRMTRAHFHMLEYNAHRTRVANSMSAFVEAASTDDQRDLILGKLVTAVVEFGDSGILDKEKDNVNVPSVAIDALTKNFGPSK